MDVTWIIPDRPKAYSFLLKEDTFFLLLETGDKIIIDSTDWSNRNQISAPTWGPRTKPTDTWTDRPDIPVSLDGNY